MRRRWLATLVLAALAVAGARPARAASDALGRVFEDAADRRPKPACTVVAIPATAERADAWTSACRSSHRAGSLARFYRFRLTGRADVELEVVGEPSAAIFLLRGTGTAGAVLRTASGDGAHAASLATTLKAGRYAIEVAALPAATSGHFTLRLWSRPPGSPGGFALVAPQPDAVDVELRPTFAWQPSPRAAEYRVFLGTAEPLPLVAAVPAPPFDPATVLGPLAPATRYLWRIEARDAAGTTASRSGIWAFTTAAEEHHGPPGPFALLTPADGAAGVSRTPLLTWEAAAGATSYTVHFGWFDPGTDFEVATTSFAPADVFGPLPSETVCFWWVTAHGAEGSTGHTGPYWTFTTATGP